MLSKKFLKIELLVLDEMSLCTENIPTTIFFVHILFLSYEPDNIWMNNMDHEMRNRLSILDNFGLSLTLYSTKKKDRSCLFTHMSISLEPSRCTAPSRTYVDSSTMWILFKASQIDWIMYFKKLFDYEWSILSEDSKNLKNPEIL